MLRRRAEQLLPAATALQLIGMLHRMPGLVPKNGHALGPGAALDLKHHLLFELHEAGVGEVERDGDTGHVCRAEPFARNPYVRPKRMPRGPNSSWRMPTQSSSQVPFGCDLQAAEALLEQPLIRQFLPGMFAKRHRGPY